MDKQPIMIITNPTAGGGRALRVLTKVNAILTKNKTPHQVMITKGPGDAITIAKNAARSNWPVVAAIGGDGTINEVVQGLAHSQTALSIIPGGTGNDLARSLGIPLQTQAAVNILRNGVIASIDCGCETNRVFSSLVSIGFPVTVIEHVNSSQGILKGPWKILAAIGKTVKQLKTFSAVVKVDNCVRQVESIGIFVQNTPFAGGGLQIAPEADPADSVFDVVIIHNLMRWELLKTLPKVYAGTHTEHPAVEFIRGRHVEIETIQPLPKMFDGEIIGHTPIKASVAPAALHVVVTRSTASQIESSRKSLLSDNFSATMVEKAQ